MSDLIAELGNAAALTQSGDTTTVTYTGYYEDNNISLGDLQKSTAHILKVVMASDQFANLFDDVEAVSWTQTYADELVSYREVTKE